MTLPSTIVLASNNSGKIIEINRMLASTPLNARPQADFGVEEASEDGLTFVENALIKARNAARATGLPALADDSGLMVDALDGAPGVLSARYAGAGANDQRNIDALMKAMESVELDQRNCRFRCVIVYLQHSRDPSPIIAEGELSGIVHSHAQGEFGFGYDPVVWIPKLNRTLAELPVEEKNRISHRFKALRSMVNKLKEQLNK